MSNEKYKISTERVKKIVRIDFIGKLEIEDGGDFFNAYGKATQGIIKKDYNVLINCKDMELFRPEVLPLMKQGYMEYNEYNHIHIIESDKTVINMQLKRIARELGLMDKISIIKDVSDLNFV